MICFNLQTENSMFDVWMICLFCGFLVEDRRLKQLHESHIYVTVREILSTRLNVLPPPAPPICLLSLAAFDLAFGALFSKVYRVRRVLSQVGGRRQRSRRSFLPLVSGETARIPIVVLPSYSTH